MNITELFQGTVHVCREAILPELLTIVDELHSIRDGYIQFMNGSILILAWTFIFTFFLFSLPIFIYALCHDLAIGIWCACTNTTIDVNDDLILTIRHNIGSIYITSVVAITFMLTHFVIFSSIWSFITSVWGYLYELSRHT